MRYVLLFLLLAFGCGLPTDSSPWRPPEAALVAPHPDYPRWWNEVQACVGISGNFDRIQWFTVEGSAFSTPDHGWAGGRWVPPHDIYLAEAHYDSEDVVKHEMIHELLRPGAAEDPRFEECSGIGHYTARDDPLHAWDLPRRSRFGDGDVGGRSDELLNGLRVRPGVQQPDH